MLKDLPPPPPGRNGWPWTEEAISTEWLAKRSDWPRVSIVMPSYNQAAFIEESIRSVILQGYPNLEFIVYDAGSTDGSANIIEKYGPWLSFWVSEKDKGQSDAINKGLNRSTGAYFNWQNSDDVLARDGIFKAVSALLEHPEASYVHGYAHLIYVNGQLHASTKHSYGSPTRLAPDVGTAVATLKTGTQPGCLMDRDLVAKLGGVDEQMHFAMDMDIMLRLAVIKPPLYLHEHLVNYRFHQNTKSHGVWPRERQFEKLRIVEKVFRMPESRLYESRKREAMSTAYRYAADCALMSKDFCGFVKHMFMDIMWSPFGGWARRRAMFYFIKERKKNDRMISNVKKDPA